MPELPEVETIRKSLQGAIVGKKIVGIEVRKAKIFRGETKGVIGKRIEAVERRGKVLIIRLTGKKALMVHFKLTGQMVWVPQAKDQKLKTITLGHPVPFAGSELPAKTTHVIIGVDGGKLFYNDLRQFGWIKIVDNDELRMLNDELGIEPFDKRFTNDYLKQVFSKTSKAIKLVLMDQTKIAGVGNIYANDALFVAGIRPDKPARELGDKDIKILRESIIKVLNDGLKFGGSSAKDEAYIKPTGEPGKYQEHFRVYQREGQKCLKCGGLIKRVNLGGRGTFFCPRCQK
jgi:formamidopyrimidine-DNA glycosylase